MSAALASAKKRASISVNNNNVGVEQKYNSNSKNAVNVHQPETKILTLQEIIPHFDNRITHLERLVSSSVSLNDHQNHTENFQEVLNEFMNDHIMEFNHRYEMLAVEIVEMKNAIMKLQSHIIDINKTLLHSEDRMRIPSDFDLQTNDDVVKQDQNNETELEINQ